MRTLVLAASAVALLLGCAKDLYTPLAEIPALTSLEDVMDNQKAAADPLFAKMDQASFKDEEFAAMAKASERLLATSTKIRAFKDGKKDPVAFEGLATRLNDKAKELGAAAAAKDAAGAKAALGAMKATCKDCHARFR